MVMCFLSGRATECLYSTFSEAWKKGKLKDEMMTSFKKCVDAKLFLRMSDLAEIGKGTLPVIMSWR